MKPTPAALGKAGRKLFDRALTGVSGHSEIQVFIAWHAGAQILRLKCFFRARKARHVSRETGEATVASPQAPHAEDGNAKNRSTAGPSADSHPALSPRDS